ncbi:MAG: hypothetical protein ACM3SS_00620 [Rhodospirillaceae bacterium]
MSIRQIQARYDELHDRILLRLSTADDTEFQFWFTRRFTRRFWELLLKTLEQDEPVRQQSDLEARKAVLAMRHEGFVQQGNFSKPFEEREYRRPLGPEPLLVARADYTPGTRPGAFTLSLRPLHGQGVDLRLNAPLLHSICKLIIDAAAKSDWDLNLAMPSATFAPVTDGPATTRTLQ